MSDTFDTIKVEPERDRFGRYLIHPAKGGKPKAYTRATTIAETLDDRFNLEAWKQRMVALGLAQRPDLYASVASLQPDEKSALNRLCDQAREAAAGSAGANLGTALHRFTERINRGEEVRVPAPWDADIAAYREALNDSRYGIDDHYLERIVVLEKFGIAGMFDMMLRPPTFTLTTQYRIADLKTGATLDFSWCAIAVQLAIYSRAETLYNPATKTHERMPLVDQDRALVIHLPAGKATCTLYEVDIAAGWEAAQHALWTRQWRKRKNLAVPATQVGGGEPVPAGTVEQATPAVDVGGGDTPTPAPTVEPAPPADPQRRQELIDHIKRLPDVEREELARRWPLGVPTFRQSDSHTDAQLDAIAEMIGNVDWSISDAAAAAAARVEAGLVGTVSIDEVERTLWQPPDEGASLDAETVDAITATIQTLDKVTLAQVNDWAREANSAQRPFSLSREEWRTQRRFEIMRAAIALSPYEPDVQRAALGFVMGDEVQPTVTVGAALGSLTISEATRLALLAESIGTTIGVTYELGGVAFSGDGLAAVAA